MWVGIYMHNYSFTVKFMQTICIVYFKVLFYLRHEPTTVECLVPANVGDKNFDIFFGMSKEPSADIESVLVY